MSGNLAKKTTAFYYETYRNDTDLSINWLAENDDHDFMWYLEHHMTCCSATVTLDLRS